MSDSAVVRRAIPAGVLDAALSSLASFAVGFYAARSLQPTVLGGYALVYSAFLLMTSVPARLLFTPVEVLAVSVPGDGSLRVLYSSLRLGLLPSLLSAVLVAFWWLAAPSTIPVEAVRALTVTVVISTFISPIQDHVRRMLHVGGLSWYAAIVSAVHVVIVLGGMIILERAGIAAVWLPFGVLALGNFVSLAVGLVLARRPSTGEPTPLDLHFPALVRSGGWLLLVGLLPVATGFIASAMVLHLAGAATLGYAEAARIIGQPPLVLSAGLSAVIGPRSVRAAQIKDARLAHRFSWIFAMLLLAAGLPYLALVGFDWAGNPAAEVVPVAYAVGGLVAATIVANIVNGAILPQQFQLLGAEKEPFLAGVEGLGNAVRIVIAGAAGVLGAFAVPLGIFALAVVRWGAYVSALTAHYRVGGGGTPDRELGPPRDWTGPGSTTAPEIGAPTVPAAGPSDALP